MATGSSWLSEIHVKRPAEKEEIRNERLMADLVWTNPEKSGNTQFNQLPLLGPQGSQAAEAINPRRGPEMGPRAELLAELLLLLHPEWKYRVWMRQERPKGRTA